ncbi:MAG: polyprenyl synthetase family protein [Chloroflexota bacterium]
MSLSDLRERFVDAIDREIDAWISLTEAAPIFQDMLRYQLGFVDANLQPRQAPGGKRFRPILCLLATEGAGGDWREALPAAASIELLHNFSLIHDDIEDHDPERHHRPTVWKLWGEPQAINAGDGMFALAGRAVLAATQDPEVANEVAEAYQDTSFKLTEGQYLDMSFESRESVSAGEYVRMIDLKTGALVAFSTWSGAAIGGGGDDVRHALREFGLLLGRAYQIHDDIMGIWGSKEATGKEAGMDLRNRKKTLPLLISLERSSADQADTLQAFFSGRSDDLDEVRKVLGVTGARDEAERQVQASLDAALEALDRAHLEREATAGLRDLARELTG